MAKSTVTSVTPGTRPRLEPSFLYASATAPADFAE